MPRIAVLFELRCAETRPGETICVLGQRPELGGWDRHAVATGGLQLRTSAFMYPRWAMLRPVWLEFPTYGTVRIEYKYVMDRRLLETAEGRKAKWEDGISNRYVTLSTNEDGVWLVSDAQWGSWQQPRVGRISMSEVCLRWNDFDPEWMTRGQLPTQRRPANFLLSPRVSSSPASDEDVAYPIVQEFNALSPDKDGELRELRKALMGGGQGEAGGATFEAHAVPDRHLELCAAGNAVSPAKPEEPPAGLAAAPDFAPPPRARSPPPRAPQPLTPPESPPVAPPESPPRTPPLRTSPPVLPRLRLMAVVPRPPPWRDEGPAWPEEEAGPPRPAADAKRDEQVAALKAENAALRERQEELRAPPEDPKKEEEMAALKAENAALKERLRELLAGQECKAPPAAAVAFTMTPRDSEGDRSDNGEGSEELLRVLARRRREVDSKGEHWTKERAKHQSMAVAGRLEANGREDEEDMMQEPQEEPQVEG